MMIYFVNRTSVGSPSCGQCDVFGCCPNAALVLVTIVVPTCKGITCTGGSCKSDGLVKDCFCRRYGHRSLTCIVGNGICVRLPFCLKANIGSQIPSLIIAKQLISVIPTKELISLSSRYRQREAAIVYYSLRRRSNIATICIIGDGICICFPFCCQCNVTSFLPCAALILFTSIIPTQESISLSSRCGELEGGVICNVKRVRRQGSACGIKSNNVGVNLPVCSIFFVSCCSNRDSQIHYRGALTTVCPTSECISYSCRCNEDYFLNVSIRRRVKRRVCTTIENVLYLIFDSIPSSNESHIFGVFAYTIVDSLITIVPTGEGMAYPYRCRKNQIFIVTDDDIFFIAGSAIGVKRNLNVVGSPNSLILTITEITARHSNLKSRLRQTCAYPTSEGVTNSSGINQSKGIRINLVFNGVITINYTTAKVISYRVLNSLPFCNKGDILSVLAYAVSDLTCSVVPTQEVVSILGGFGKSKLFIISCDYVTIATCSTIGIEGNLDVVSSPNSLILSITVVAFFYNNFHSGIGKVSAYPTCKGISYSSGIDESERACIDCVFGRIAAINLTAVKIIFNVVFNLTPNSA